MFAANSRASSAKLRSSHICKVRSKSSGHLSWLLIKSFGCGVGTAILLFALAAQIFAHTALSLELVKPATCASVAVGLFFPVSFLRTVLLKNDSYAVFPWASFMRCV